MELVKIPEFGATLAGADSFHEWATEARTYFELIDVTDENTIWDIVTGVHAEPKISLEKGQWVSIARPQKKLPGSESENLRSIPTFYANTIENIGSKKHEEYDTVARKLREYIKPKAGKNGGTANDPIVLKTTTEDNGKRWQYCIKVKKWRGLNHTEDECRTKKRDRENKKEAKVMMNSSKQQ